jgi:hypothetical protein
MTGGDENGSLSAAKVLARFGPDRLRALVRERRFEQSENVLGDLRPFRTPDIEAALGDGRLRADQVRLALGRDFVEPAALKLVHRHRLDRDGIQQMLAQGAIVIFNDADRCFPALAGLAMAIGEAFGVSTEVVALLNFSGRSGLDEHHDSENVLILQLEGEKVWHMLGAPVEPGIKSKGYQREPGAGTTLTMRPGDVMFLPAGQRHRCEASPAGSLHIAILLHAPKATVAAQELTEIMKDDPALNASILTFGDDEATERAEAIRARMHELVDRLDIARALTRENAWHVAAPGFAFTGKGTNLS